MKWMGGTKEWERIWKGRKGKKMKWTGGTKEWERKWEEEYNDISLIFLPAELLSST